jgi:hypothetical protein
MFVITASDFLATYGEAYTLTAILSFCPEGKFRVTKEVSP